MKKNIGFIELLVKKYGNLTKAAVALGYSRQRLNKITQGYHIPTLDECRNFSEKLETPFEEIANFFC